MSLRTRELLLKLTEVKVVLYLSFGFIHFWGLCTVHAGIAFSKLYFVIFLSFLFNIFASLSFCFLMMFLVWSIFVLVYMVFRDFSWFLTIFIFVFILALLIKYQYVPTISRVHNPPTPRFTKRIYFRQIKLVDNATALLYRFYNFYLAGDDGVNILQIMFQNLKIIEN